MTHPYRDAPDRAFWGRAVSANFDVKQLVPLDGSLLAEGDRVMSAGSCFAANIVPYLERNGITYVWAERPHPSFAEVHEERLSYHKFSAAYGNIYTVRHLRQLIERSLGLFSPREDRWHLPEGIIDPFRPGLRFVAQSDLEFDALTQRHLAAVRSALAEADVFVFTLGLTEGWESTLDGAVFPACPGTVYGRGAFSPERHRFHNFSVAEMVEDLGAAMTLMRQIRPGLRFILSVSPVPLVATATQEHVLPATIYSKSALRVAAQEVLQKVPGVTYFPAYEIVTGPQAPWEFFEADRREPSRLAIDTVMSVFLKGGVAVREAEPGAAALASSALSDAVAQIECEEAGSAV
jgi:hypothetical protein